MATFRIDVTETRDYQVIYTVEAATLAEAEAKAEIGETIAEEEVGGGDVSDRFVHGECPQ